MSDGQGPEDNNEGVQLLVDQDRCIGIGQCEVLEPDVFRLDDDSGLADVVSGAMLGRTRAEIVVDRCPSGAIAIQELG